MMKKKLLAVLLCLTLATGLLPTTVWAAETGCLKHKEYTVRGANFNENTVVETLPSCNSFSPKIGNSINTLLWGALLFLAAAPLLELLLLRSPKILRRFCLADLYLVNCANWFIPFGRALEEYFA